MPGRVHRLDRKVAQLQRPAVGERLVLVLGLGQLVDVDRRPGAVRKPPVSGDVVGVVVRLQHVPDPHSVQPRQPPVGLDVPLRIDHHRHPRIPGRRPGRRHSRGPRGLSGGRASSRRKGCALRLARNPAARAAARIPPSAAVAQLARASACHAEGRGFESLQPLRFESPALGQVGLPGGKSNHPPHIASLSPSAEVGGDVRPGRLVPGSAAS